MRKVLLAAVLFGASADPSLAARSEQFTAVTVSSGQGLRVIVSNVQVFPAGVSLAACPLTVLFLRDDGIPLGQPQPVQLMAGGSVSVVAASPQPGLITAIVSIAKDFSDRDRICSVQPSLEVFDAPTGRTLFSVASGACLGNGKCSLQMTLLGPITSFWQRFEQYILRVPPAASIIGPVSAATLAAMISAFVLFWIARRYTVRIKQIESTLEFSKRFQELLKEQRELNRNFAATPRTTEEQDGSTWWWRFFDLILYEFDFYHQRLVRQERFTEWMKWRWFDFRATGTDVWQTCGIEYKRGWELWKEKDAMRLPKPNRLITFLDKIHDAPDVSGVVRLCRKNSPRWYRPWRRFHLT